MADVFSQQLSKQVVHISPSDEEYKKALAGLNVPEFLHEFLVFLYGSITKGQWEKVSDDYTLLTGNKPNTFTDFVKENRSIFLGTS